MNDSGPLELLYRVQQLDLDLDRLHAEKQHIPEPLRLARQEQENNNNKLEDAEIDLENTIKNIKRLELDVSSTNEQIARNKVEQEKNAFNAKVQSQYANLIQQLSERVSEFEESLIPFLEQRTVLEEERNQLREKHSNLRPQLDSLENEDEARVKDLQEKIAELAMTRNQLASSIESRLLKEYELIRKAKRGLGIAQVEGGRCTGCNMQLPMTVQQRAATHKLPAVKCPSCGRFLLRDITS